MADALKFIFAGTPTFAAHPLTYLCAMGLRPQLVLTQPDRPAGRGKHATACAVKLVALAEHIPLLQPPTLSDLSVQQQLRDVQPDLIIVLAYGLMLPPAVLSIPRLGCVNVHASLLPRWRGAAPIQRALQAGDPETGLTLMQMDAGLDTGPMLRQETLPILAHYSAQMLHDALAQLSGPLLEDFLQHPEIDLKKAKKQPLLGITYAEKLSKAEARLNWQHPAEFLARSVRAYNAWPVSWFEWQGQPLRVWSAQVQMANTAFPGQVAQPGQVAKPEPNRLLIGAGDGHWLEPLQIQPPGRQPMSCADWCRGRGQALQAGEVLR